MGAPKTPSKTTQETTVKLGPEQKQVFEAAFPYVQQYASTPLQQYQGQTIAGFTPLEQQAQQGYVNAAGTTGALGQQAAASNFQLMDPSQMLDVANNPYVQGAGQAIASGMTHNLMENILPGVRSGATAAGGMYSGGSSREGIATGKAIGETQSSISSALADLAYKSYTSNLAAMGDAIGRNSNVQQQQLFGSDVLAAVGGQERAMQQAQIDEQIRKFYLGQQLPFLQAQDLLGILQGMPGGTTSSVSTGTPAGTSPLMSGLGGASIGGALGPLLGVSGPVGAGIGLLGAILMNR